MKTTARVKQVGAKKEMSLSTMKKSISLTKKKSLKSKKKKIPQLQEKQPNRGLDQAVIEDEFNKFVDTIVKDNQERLKGKRFNAEKQSKLDALVNSSPYGYLKVRNRIIELRMSA